MLQQVCTKNNLHLLFVECRGSFLQPQHRRFESGIYCILHDENKKKTTLHWDKPDKQTEI